MSPQREKKSESKDISKGREYNLNPIFIRVNKDLLLLGWGGILLWGKFLMRKADFQWKIKNISFYIKDLSLYI